MLSDGLTVYGLNCFKSQAYIMGRPGNGDT